MILIKFNSTNVDNISSKFLETMYDFDAINNIIKKWVIDDYKKYSDLYEYLINDDYIIVVSSLSDTKNENLAVCTINYDSQYYITLENNNTNCYTYAINYDNQNCVDRFINNIVYSKLHNLNYLYWKLGEKDPRYTINNYIKSDTFENDFALIRNLYNHSKRLSELCASMMEHMTDNAIE